MRAEDVEMLDQLLTEIRGHTEMMERFAQRGNHDEALWRNYRAEQIRAEIKDFVRDLIDNAKKEN